MTVYEDLFDSTGKRGGTKGQWHKEDPIQRVVWKYIMENQGGCVMGITGRANTGKSHTANGIINLWNPELKIEQYICYEPDEVFERTFQNLKLNDRHLSKEEFEKIPTNEIKTWCYENISSVKVRPGTAILIDEAGATMSSRDFFTAENKAISKLVQVWRFMRMLVIFVVPERFEFVEKTLREFMDVKIQMLNIDRREGYARARILERYGRDFKTGDPLFASVEGCKAGGFIRIWPLHPNIAEEYERLSAKFKATSMLLAWREAAMANMPKADKRQLNDRFDIKRTMDEARKVSESLKDIQKKKIVYSIPLIQNKFSISAHTARRIKAQLELEERTEVVK